MVPTVSDACTHCRHTPESHSLMNLYHCHCLLVVVAVVVLSGVQCASTAPAGHWYRSILTQHTHPQRLWSTAAAAAWWQHDTGQAPCHVCRTGQKVKVAAAERTAARSDEGDTAAGRWRWQRLWSSCSTSAGSRGHKVGAGLCLCKVDFESRGRHAVVFLRTAVLRHQNSE